MIIDANAVKTKLYSQEKLKGHLHEIFLFRYPFQKGSSPAAKYKHVSKSICVALTCQRS